MKSLGDFKRGDTFAFFANIKDRATGDPVDYGPDVMSCQIRNAANKLYGDFIITKHDTIAGRYFFKAGAEVTKLWPASIDGVLLYIDIEIRIGDVVLSTDTFTVNVIQDVTKVV